MLPCVNFTTFFQSMEVGHQWKSFIGSYGRPLENQFVLMNIAGKAHMHWSGWVRSQTINYL